MNVFQFWNQLTESERLLLIVMIPILYPKLEFGIIYMLKSIWVVAEILWKFIYRWIIGFLIQSIGFWLSMKKLWRWIRWIQSLDKPITPIESLISRYIYFGRFGEYKPPIYPYKNFWF